MLSSSMSSACDRMLANWALLCIYEVARLIKDLVNRAFEEALKDAQLIENIAQKSQEQSCQRCPSHFVPLPPSAGSGKAKKGSKGGAAADAPKESTLSKEVKSTTVVGANILKDGADPKILPDSEYREWLSHLLDKRPALSELRRKDLETLPYEDLKRFVKLDNRARIKENNSIKAKN
nr:39S ribosomal protein L54, mitochondrial-like [Coffea arabica]